jgi:4-amino-4-deoxy-L-arabinose transferase-like glycosyltransferase
VTRDPAAGFARAVGAVALVGLVLRLVYVLVPGLRPDLGFDGTWYALQAGTIGDGIGYVDPYRFYSLQGAFPTAHFPPLWPGLLSLVYDLGFGGRTAYRVTGALVGTVTVALTAALGRTLVNARTGVVAAAIVAISPFMIAADGSLMTESLYTALVTAAVLVGVKARRTRRIGWFTACCLFLGLATLTRGDGLVVAMILVPVVAAGSADSWAPRLARIALAVVVIAAVLTPWAVRNERQLGEPVILSSNGGALIAGANCDLTYGGSQLAAWDSACARAAGRRSDPELVRSDAQREAGVDYIREHLPRAAFVAVLRVVRGWGFWNPDALLDAEVVESRTRWLQAIGWVASLVVVAAAVSGAVRLWRSRAEIAELVAVIVAATLVLATSWGNQRFRLVATPELAVLAAVAFLALWDRRRTEAVPAGP